MLLVSRETCCYLCMKLRFECVCKSLFKETVIICLNEIFTCETPFVLEIIHVNIVNVVRLHSVPHCTRVLGTSTFWIQMLRVLRSYVYAVYFH